MEEERKKRAELAEELRRQRRDDAIDACAGIVGALVGLGHLHAPWVVILEILHAVWILEAYVALSALAGTYFAWEAVVVHRRLSRLT